MCIYIQYTCFLSLNGLFQLEQEHTKEKTPKDQDLAEVTSLESLFVTSLETK